jgi:tetratricopeptide (TPR) repeat protein
MDVIDHWQLDRPAAVAMRLDRVRHAMSTNDFQTAMVEAEELLDVEPDHGEALFLLGESLLEMGESQAAILAYEQCLSAATPWSAALVGLTIARFESCNLAQAIDSGRQAVAQFPERAEAHFFLALSLERLWGNENRDVRGEALGAFVAAHQLDSASYPYPLELSDQDWQTALQEALRRIPVALQSFWVNVPIHFENVPDLDELRQALPPIPPTTTGLFVGSPPDEGDPWQVRPQALRLFKDNLARAVSYEELVLQLAITLEQESLEWLGLASNQLIEP